MKNDIRKGVKEEMADITLYDPETMAKKLGVEPITVIRNARKGLIPHKKIGKRYYFPKEIIEKWLKETTIMPESPSMSSKVG